MLLFLASSVAFAMCESPPPTIIPADGAVDIPLGVVIQWNTEVQNADIEPVLTDADGAVVPTTLTWAASAGLQVYGSLAPDAPLTAGTTYTVADGSHAFTFTTGTAGESAPPAVPVVATVDADADVSGETTCSGVTSWEEDREHVSITLATEAATAGYLEAQVRVDGGEPTLVRGASESLLLGWGGCHVSNLPDMRESTAITVTVRAVTYDGQASDWGDETAIDVPWPPGPDCPEASTGCATGGLTPSIVGVLVAVSALRRRRSAASGRG